VQGRLIRQPALWQSCSKGKHHAHRNRFKDQLTKTAIGRDLGRSRGELILNIDDENALIQCQVSAAVAAAMLAPLGRNAVGQFRPVSGNLVEYATVTLPIAIRMLEAHAAASEGVSLH
jgi:hypothetical protein